MASDAPKAEVYRAKDGYRWRLQGRNGRILAESSEAYTRRADAWRGYENTRDTLAKALEHDYFAL